jgi:hypothetical protein
VNIIRGNALSMELDNLTHEQAQAPSMVAMKEWRRLLLQEPCSKLGDDPPPWRQHGWLLAVGISEQAWLLTIAEVEQKFRAEGSSVLAGFDAEMKQRYPHMVDAIRSGRLSPGVVPIGWGYMMATLLNQRLPDEPLPAVLWDQKNNQKVGAYLQKLMCCINAKHGAWSRLRILMEWMGYGLAVHDRYPPELDDHDAEQLYRMLDLCFFWLHPCDIWGSLMSENIGSGWNPNAFFPTPMNLTEMMAQMVAHDEGAEQRHLTVMDPCVGTGRMLLSAGNRSMRLYGIDVDPLMALATKINLAIHQPWGVVTFSDRWWGKEMERLGLGGASSSWTEQSGQAEIGIRVAEAEDASEMAGYDVEAVAAARTMNVGGQVIQPYLPGFWKDNA